MLGIQREENLNITVTPQKLGVVVMKNDRDIDPVATQLIRDNHQVELPRVRGAHTFRPILQVRFTTRNSISGLIAVVKFDYRKDGRLLWSWPQPQVFERQAMFYPDITLNIAPYRNAMVGFWSVEAGISIIRESTLATVESGRRVDFLTSLMYQEIASFEWEIIVRRRRVDDVLTPTGERRRIQPESNREVTLTIDEI